MAITTRSSTSNTINPNNTPSDAPTTTTEEDPCSSVSSTVHSTTTTTTTSTIVTPDTNAGTTTVHSPPHPLPPATRLTLQENLELAVLGPTPTVMDLPEGEETAVLNLDAALAESKTSDKTPGKRVAEGLTVHTEEYCVRKKRYIRNFIGALKKEKKWHAFLKPTKEVPDFFQLEEEGGGTVEAVFVLLYPGDGLDRNKKVRTLSDMLIDWVNGMEIPVGKGGKKNNEKEGVAKRWHAPATINVMIRSFLAATKDLYGWDFAISEFNHVGGFNAFLKNLFAERQKIDVSNC
jgi:hypothetical protein